MGEWVCVPMDERESGSVGQVGKIAGQRKKDEFLFLCFFVFLFLEENNEFFDILG